MEQSLHIKIISTIVITLLILGALYVLLSNYNASVEIGQQISDTNDSQKSTVVVESTPMVNGILTAPAGFSQDIPLEKGEILESATTRYQGQDARQLSVSYRSSKTVDEKYMEYKNYMKYAGYSMTESDTNSSVKAIFGTKEDSNLSVAISSSGGKTLIQLSYLLKLMP